MRIKVVHRIPSTSKQKTFECTSKEEFLNIPFVKRNMNNPEVDKLRIVIRNNEPHALMCDFKQDFSWNIADLYGDVDQLDLPQNK